MNKGILMVLSGPSGCGKGTVLKQFLAERKDTEVSVSVTTRSPRPGEIDGVHYYFRTREQFEQMIADNELLEYAEYNGNYYGTPAKIIQQKLDAGINVILEIEVQGAEKVMSRRPDVLSVFLSVPSMKELEERLRGRGTEKDDVIHNRMAIAVKEMARAHAYRYIVLNDEVDLAVQRLNCILEAEKMRTPYMKKYILEGPTC